MELDIARQLHQAAGSIFWGGVLALFYDALRALRRGIYLPEKIADLVFCPVLLAALFRLGMGLGDGQLRIFMALCVCLGAAMYLGCISPFLLPKLTKTAKRLILPIKLGKSFVKKLIFFQKSSSNLTKNGLE